MNAKGTWSTPSTRCHCSWPWNNRDHIRHRAARGASGGSTAITPKVGGGSQPGNREGMSVYTVAGWRMARIQMSVPRTAYTTR